MAGDGLVAVQVALGHDGLDAGLGLLRAVQGDEGAEDGLQLSLVDFAVAVQVEDAAPRM